MRPGRGTEERSLETEISVENALISKSSILNNKAVKMRFQISDGFILLKDIPVRQ